MKNTTLATKHSLSINSITDTMSYIIRSISSRIENHTTKELNQKLCKNK